MEVTVQDGCEVRAEMSVHVQFKVRVEVGGEAGCRWR